MMRAMWRPRGTEDNFNIFFAKIWWYRKKVLPLYHQNKDSEQQRERIKTANNRILDFCPVNKYSVDCFTISTNSI
jgi:hypothetical protein